MLRRAGYEDVTVFERGERVGGVWHHNTYPGAACDIPSHLYEFSFAPEPALVAALRAAGRDPGLRRGRRPRATACSTGSAPAPRCTARAGTRRAAAGCSRRAPGPHEADVLLTACGQLSVPQRPADPGPRRASPARRSTPRAGATTSTSPASASPWSAPAAARSRSCRRSSRSSAQRRRLPALARLDVPEDGLRLQAADAAAVRALPGRSSGSTARRSSPSRRLGAAAHDPPPLAAARRSAPSARRQITKAIEDPELRRKVTPRRRDRLQADHAHRRLVPDAHEARTSSSSPTGSPQVTPGGIRTADGDRARRPTCSCSPRASRRTGSSRPMEIAGARRPHARRGVGRACRAPTSG